MVKIGNVYQPTDKRRDGRRIRIDRIVRTKGVRYALVSGRQAGRKAWEKSPAIRLDRLESRHYKLIRGA